MLKNDCSKKCYECKAPLNFLFVFYYIFTINIPGIKVHKEWSDAGVDFLCDVKIDHSKVGQIEVIHEDGAVEGGSKGDEKVTLVSNGYHLLHLILGIEVVLELSFE